MFDDQPINATVPPANLPVEPDDIFKAVDENATKVPNALDNGLLKKKVPAPGPAPAPSALSPKMDKVETNPLAAEAGFSETKSPILGKIIVSVLLLAIVGAIGFGAWWLYRSDFFSKSPVSTNQTEITAPEVTTTPADETNLTLPTDNTATQTTEMQQTTPAENLPTQVNNDQILFNGLIDTDRDGLDDTKETEVGTSISNPDTDGDGLSDGDEVLIWRTNPLNPDTDGDTFPDGTEVRNGYNPLGPGKFSGSPTTNNTTLPKTTSTNK